MEIIAVVNQKGGVGKTTTCMNLSASLAVIGKKVLLIDMDPQGNASTGLGVPLDRREVGSYSLLIGHSSISESITKTNIKGLDIISSNVNLAAAELELKDLENREYILKNALASLRNQSYDHVIIDCPPSLSLITVNALCASDSLIIPMQCEFFSLEGLSHLLKTVRIVQSRLNPNLIIKGIVLTMFDRRNRVSASVEKEVRKHLGTIVYDTVIPRNVKIAEAPSFGKPAIAYDHTSTGARAYIRLVKEILLKTHNNLK